MWATSARCVLAQGADAPKPVAVVALSGYDALMADIDFLGSLADMQGASQLVEMALNQATQNKGLVGLEKDKPIGLIVQSSSAGDFSGAVCVPSADPKPLLETLAAFGVESQEMGDGVLQVSAPNGQSAYAKSVGEWTFLSIMPQMLETLPADPSAPLEALAKEYDLAVRLNVQNIPEIYRQMAISALMSGANQSMQQEEGESDEQFAARQAGLAAQLQEIQRGINELDELTLGLSIDSQQQRTYLDVAFTALPNTKLAKNMARNARPTTNFAGFFQPDAAMRMSFASKASEADAAQFDQMLDTVKAQADRAIDKESKLEEDEDKARVKQAVADMLDAARATLKAGLIDGGAVLNMSPESLTFVAGGFIGEPTKVDSALKNLVEVAQKTDKKFPKVNWKSAKVGDVTFHTLKAPLNDPDDSGARRLFGEAIEMAVGIGKESVYFSMGRDCMAAVKQVIEQSSANRGKAIAPMEMTFALGQIMKMAEAFAEEEHKPQWAQIAKMLDDEAEGRDHVRIVAQAIPNGQRSRLEAEEGVLRAIGMAVMQAQAAAGAGF